MRLDSRRSLLRSLLPEVAEWRQLRSRKSDPCWWVQCSRWMPRRLVGMPFRVPSYQIATRLAQATWDRLGLLLQFAALGFHCCQSRKFSAVVYCVGGFGEDRKKTVINWDESFVVWRIWLITIMEGSEYCKRWFNKKALKNFFSASYQLFMIRTRLIYDRLTRA